MIVDAHVHLGTARWMREIQEVDLIRQKIRAAGVDKVCSFPFVDRGMDANDHVWQTTQGQEEFIPIALCDPTERDAIPRLERELERGMRGIKLHPFCHGYPLDLYELTDPMFEVAAAYKVPILCHCFTDCPFNTAGQLNDMAGRHPGVNLVALHGGFMWSTWGLIDYAKTRRNLFIETSNLYPKMITDGVNACGAEQFIFGTDSPWSDQGLEVEKIMRAVKSSDAQEQILGGNILRLLEARAPVPA
jgi:predicted TIM-barrel fold metal-dependent hydrolase